MGNEHSAVTPFDRALAILEAFTSRDLWLTNAELTERCHLNRSTVSRLAQTLVAQGYLHFDEEARKYRLAAAVLALGYAAVANTDARQVARVKLKSFAEAHKVQVILSTRDRLDMIVVENFSSAHAPIALSLPVGARVGLASSPLGWALLAALPRQECYYLLQNVERRTGREWSRLRRRCSQAMAQVSELGFCTSLGDWSRELGVVAASVTIPGSAPLVMACVGGCADITRARAERELGPQLVGLAESLQRTEERV